MHDSRIPAVAETQLNFDFAAKVRKSLVVFRQDKRLLAAVQNDPETNRIESKHVLLERIDLSNRIPGELEATFVQHKLGA